jgi:hypothetical protein
MGHRSYRDMVLSWPELTPPIDLGALRGRVVHKVFQHDDWCRTLNGGRASDCNCNPAVSYRLQPKDL